MEEIIKLTNYKLRTGLLWMKENWMTNGWNVDGDIRFEPYQAINRLLDGNAEASDLDLLLIWTHPRTELVGMSIPPDVNNSGGWGAVRRLNEIHEALMVLKIQRPLPGKFAG